MPHPENIHARPHALDRLLRLSPTAGTTIYPRIYVSRLVMSDLVSDTPDPHNLALIEHEQTHVNRIRVYGAARWYASYAISAKFRLSEELEAYQAQFVILKAAGLESNIEQRARMLSGAAYLWPTTYENAYSQLNDIWEAIDPHPSREV